MYGLRYGTLPLVRRVGGLADTVVDADDERRCDQRDRLRLRRGHPARAADRAERAPSRCYRQPQRWAALMRRGMAQDHSWAGPAKQYMALYETVPGIHGS